MATIAEELAKATVTDSFLRTENPLSNGGKWTKPSWAQTIGETRLASGWRPPSGFAVGADGAKWGTNFVSSATTYIFSIIEINSYRDAEDKEISNTAERWWGVWGCLPAEAQSGYRLRAECRETIGSGTGKYNLKLEKATVGVFEVLGETIVEIATNKHGAVGLVIGNGKVYAYYKKEESSAWTQAVEKSSATYTEGKSGVSALGNFFRGQNFRTGTFELEAEPGVMKPNAASATASRGEGVGVANHVVETGEVAAAAASMPNVELVGGAMPSASEREHKGLPLPFPSVLANPGRLGPPRFKAADRKTLGIKR